MNLESDFGEIVNQFWGKEKSGEGYGEALLNWRGEDCEKEVLFIHVCFETWEMYMLHCLTCVSES